jgi:hypothetical protein
MGSRLREGTKQVFDCFLEIVPAREEVSLLVFFTSLVARKEVCKGFISKNLFCFLIEENLIL